MAIINKIRKGVFETNSSSTHSICVPKQGKLEIPKSIAFDLGEFGWEEDVLDIVPERASYLYTAFCYNDRLSDFEKIVRILEDKGISVFVEPYSKNDCYIDHGSQLNGFLDNICANENLLMQYLFSSESYIQTGNDNDESCVSDDDVDPIKYYTFYKGG